VERALGTYLHGPLLPRNPWLADWLLARALAQRRAASRARSTPCRTSWSSGRSGSQPGGHGCAAAEPEADARGFLEGHPGPPPTASVAAKSSRVARGACRVRVE
jgi:hypothetical protein